MIDAGHVGFYNRSPVVPEYWESVAMWKLHEFLAEELELYGFEVFKTRKDINEDMAVVKRGKRSKGCDLFLSLHSNAVGEKGSESVDRVDVYGAYDNLNDSHKLAKSLAVAIGDVMGVKGGGHVKTRKSNEGDWEYYGVLRGARNVGCPLFYIVEHSFHTNELSARWLLKEENLRRLAETEAAVIGAFYGMKKPAVLGDVNQNGKLDRTDYVLLKRSCFGTIELSEEQKKLADFNGDGKIDSRDYIALKRKMFEN